MANELIDWWKSETDRLSEIAPQIPAVIKEMFKRRFHDTVTSVPTILNGLEEVEITSDVAQTPKTAKPVIRLIQSEV